MALNLKYAAVFKTLSDCPPEAAVPKDTTGYRFVFSDISDHRNFRPVAQLTPNRRLVNGRLAKECCAAYALSMFATKSQLIDKAKSALSLSPQFRKRVGTHYAELVLTKQDGLCGKPNRIGHFEFFEASTYSFPPSVKDHAELKV